MESKFHSESLLQWCLRNPGVYMSAYTQHHSTPVLAIIMLTLKKANSGTFDSLATVTQLNRSQI